MSYTPGPWFFNPETDEIICEAREGREEIATVVTGWNEPFESEQQANARLIAAAPELLEIAESILADDMIQYLPNEYVAKVRAAIAKATGG